MITIDGDSLPAVEYEDDLVRSEVQSASITLRADETCTMTMDFFGTAWVFRR